MDGWPGGTPAGGELHVGRGYDDLRRRERGLVEQALHARHIERLVAEVHLRIQPLRKGAQQLLVVRRLRREALHDRRVHAHAAAHDVQVLADGGERAGALHLDSNLLASGAQARAVHLSERRRRDRLRGELAEELVDGRAEIRLHHGTRLDGAEGLNVVLQMRAPLGLTLFNAHPGVIRATPTQTTCAGTQQRSSRARACSLASSCMMGGGSTSGRMERIWPSFTKVGPSCSRLATARRAMSRWSRSSVPRRKALARLVSHGTAMPAKRVHRAVSSPGRPFQNAAMRSSLYTSGRPSASTASASKPSISMRRRDTYDTSCTSRECRSSMSNDALTLVISPRLMLGSGKPGRRLEVPVAAGGGLMACARVRVRVGRASVAPRATPAPGAAPSTWVFIKGRPAGMPSLPCGSTTAQQEVSAPQHFFQIA